MKFSSKYINSTFIFCIVTTLFFNKVQSQDIVSFIREIENYKSSTDLNKHLNDIDSTTFNLRDYIGKFDKIRVRAGYLLDFKYFDNFLDGKPYIYAKTDTFNLDEYLKQKTLKCINADTVYNHEITITHKPPFDFLDENIKSKQYRIIYSEESYRFVFQRELYNFLNDSVNRAYNYLIPDDNEEGYFQYLYFKEYGERFCIKWHEAYNSKKIILDSFEFAKIISGFTKDDFCSKKEFLKIKKLKSLKPDPIIDLNEEFCKITLVEEEFYGIYKRTYMIKRSFPYEIKIENEEELVEICPNIMF